MVVLLVAAAICGGCAVRVLPVDPARLGGLAATSRMLAADGSLLAELHGEQDRTPLPLAAVPPLLVQAVLAAEDRRFFDHEGVDARGVARAAIRDVGAGRADEGGSTITEQLVKNTLVTPQRTVTRKVREATLALGLEQSLSKQQILERYLDTVYFGQGAYGAGAALHTWFGISATAGDPPPGLSAGQAALLAGLIRSPSSADPLAHPDAARARRATVLQAMVETGVLTPAAASAAATEPLPDQVVATERHDRAPYAVDDAIRTLLADPRLGPTRADREDALFRGGLTIRLTLDPAQQAAAERAVAAVLTSPHDPDVGLAAVTPGTGAITAMVGGRNYASTTDPTAKVNLARGGTTKRQAGSTFKVFTLITALEHGITPDDRLRAGAHASIPRAGGSWEVDNDDGAAYDDLTLRDATADSVNTAFAHLVERLGDGDPDRGAAMVAGTAELLGIRGAGESRVRLDPATTLGAQEVDPVEMAAAYATLAAGGRYAEPYLVASVTTPDGRPLLVNHPRTAQRVPAGVAAAADDVLAGVLAHGTGRRAALPRPAAGKTGTASGFRDAWFVGFTPDLAAAVWLGRASAPVPMTPANGFRTVVQGGTLPAEIWEDFALAALVDRPPRPFDPAPTVPDVVGLDLATATARLQGLGFLVRVGPEDAAWGAVTAQVPAAGAVVAGGDLVTLTPAPPVAATPPPVTIPPEAPPPVTIPPEAPSPVAPPPERAAPSGAG